MSDDHPFIIKMPDEEYKPEHGLGYEIFHGMRQHSGNIAQLDAETGETDTYGELLDRCVRVAVNLKKQVTDNDFIVGVSASKHFNACVPYIAGLFLSKKVVAINASLALEQLTPLLQNVTPTILFVDDHSLSHVERSLELTNLQIKLVVIGSRSERHQSFTEYLIASQEDVSSFQPINPKSLFDTAVICCSSGTTGVPKGICLSHYGLLVRSGGGGLPISLVFSELFWISFVIFHIRLLRTGSTRVQMNEFEIGKVWRAIDKYKIGVVFACVYSIAEFAKTPKPDDVDISSLLVLISGGAALPPEIILKCKELFPSVVTVQSYGITEVCGLAIAFDLTRADHRELQMKKPNSCGTPINGLWYKIVDLDTEEILGPNKPGQLWMKSKLAMVGYHNMDSSEVRDSAGWIKSGDILQYDEDHCFFIVDRIKDILKYRNGSFSSSDLENVLMAHPSVSVAAVFGIPHGEDADHATGVVTLRPNMKATPEELEKYVEERVSDQQKLRGGVRIVKELPLTGTGKVQKSVLKKLILDGKL